VDSPITEYSFSSIGDPQNIASGPGGNLWLSVGGIGNHIRKLVIPRSS